MGVDDGNALLSSPKKNWQATVPVTGSDIASNPNLEPWQLLRQIQLPPRQANDNYELSEAGDDSDVDDDVLAAARSKKHIPKWCDTYMETLRKQADVDPDTVFGSRVPQCFLDDILTDTHYRAVGRSRPKRARGSSCNWSRDRLTKHEVTAYKRKLGQSKTWLVDRENMPPAS